MKKPEHTLRLVVEMGVGTVQLYDPHWSEDSRDLVEPMVAQLLVGSAALLERDGDAAGLRAKVTSPGGTTAAGLRVLEERAVRAGFIDAVQAATARSRELGAD